MSLRIWLPLNGTLDNQGLDDIVVINNGATIDNSGKIGKCYSFDGSDDYISLTGNCLYNIIKGGASSFSISFWIYQADSTRAIIFGDYGLAGGIGFNIELTTSHCIRFYWNGSPDLGISQINIGTTTWSHVVLVYDTAHLYGYLNGNLVYTYTRTLTVKNKTSGNYYLGRDSRTGSTTLNGKMNDFRIYDHALSPMEVKQISQGLILHYPLNNNGWGQKNLLAGTNQIFTSNNEFNRTLDLAPIFDSYGLVSYTISFDLKSTDVSNRNIIMVYCQNGSGTRYSISQNYINNITTEFKRYSVTVTPILEKQNLTQSYLAFYGNYNTGNKPVVKNIKVELGEKATPWCPNEADELYNKLGLNDNVEYDTSGYNHNLKNFNKFSFSSDTPRYSVSTELAGTSYGTHQYLFLNDNYQKELTVSCWIKRTSSENTRRYISNSWVALYLYSDFAPRISWRNSTGTSDTLNTWAPGGAIPINTWTHICFTIKDGIVKYYKNGIHVSTSDRTQYGTLIHGSLSNGFGGESLTSNNWIGGLSDFRIYCTALSTEDILALYKNSVYIDNEGNLYGAELREV